MTITNISNTIMPNTNKLEDQITKIDPAKLKDEKRLKEVCEDFESIFINMMLKSGRNTVQDGGLVEKSSGTKMFEEMYDQEMSTAISKSGDGGIGIAKMLYDQMKLTLNHTLKPNPEVEDEIVE